MMQKLADMKSKVFPGTVWQDIDQISESFDLALSPEVIGWFHQQNGDAPGAQAKISRAALDEYELSLM